MALEQQKQALAEWSARIANTTDNMTELDSDMVYQLVYDGAAADRLRSNISGTTRRQLGPAIAGMQELWVQRQLVQDVIDNARRLYDQWVRCPPNSRQAG